MDNRVLDVQDFLNETVLPVIRLLEKGGIAAVNTYYTKERNRIGTWEAYFGSSPISKEGKEANELVKTFNETKEHTRQSLETYIGSFYGLAKKNMPFWVRQKLEEEVSVRYG